MFPFVLDKSLRGTLGSPESRLRIGRLGATASLEFRNSSQRHRLHTQFDAAPLQLVSSGTQRGQWPLSIRLPGGPAHPRNFMVPVFRHEKARTTRPVSSITFSLRKMEIQDGWRAARAGPGGEGWRRPGTASGLRQLDLNEEASPRWLKTRRRQTASQAPIPDDRRAECDADLKRRDERPSLAKIRPQSGRFPDVPPAKIDALAVHCSGTLASL